jgi:hypothetical protein
MSNLNTEPNIKNADDFYADLLAIHEGSSKQQSDAINAKLILILANHIGDSAILSAALKTAGSEKAT